MNFIFTKYNSIVEPSLFELTKKTKFSLFFCFLIMIIDFSLLHTFANFLSIIYLRFYIIT